jgi:hypothetical protein
MNNLPFLRSYWVAPGKLLAGAYPGSSNPSEAKEKLAGLVAAGVTRAISLMHESETNHSGQVFIGYESLLKKLAIEHGRTVECFRYPIVDGSIPDPGMMEAVLDAIDESISSNGTVYVHCWGGRGRTGTVICCWLIRHQLALPERAIDHLQTLIKEKAALFHPTPENSNQQAFVRNWSAEKQESDLPHANTCTAPQNGKDVPQPAPLRQRLLLQKRNSVRGLDRERRSGSRH